jgi:hypothetical protein
MSIEFISSTPGQQNLTLTFNVLHNFEDYTTKINIDVGLYTMCRSMTEAEKAINSDVHASS